MITLSNNELFLYQWKNSRQAHSRIIQIVEVKFDMGKTLSNLQSHISHYYNEFGELPIQIPLVIKK